MVSQMTFKQLIGKDAADLEKMSDAELEEYCKPYLRVVVAQPSLPGMSKPQTDAKGKKTMSLTAPPRAASSNKGASLASQAELLNRQLEAMKGSAATQK
jgi:hypothetical protein